MEVMETKIASIEDVIQILEKNKTELTYEQQLALQHAKKFSLTKAKTDKFKKALEAMSLMSERSIITILASMPKNEMTLRQILANERKAFSDEDVKKIVAVTKEMG